MKQTWRWFGPADLVSIDDMRQAGVEGVVSALHHRAPGEVWALAEEATMAEEQLLYSAVAARLVDGVSAVDLLRADGTTLASDLLVPRHLRTR